MPLPPSVNELDPFFRFLEWSGLIIFIIFIVVCLCCGYSSAKSKNTKLYKN